MLQLDYMQTGMYDYACSNSDRLEKKLLGKVGKNDLGKVGKNDLDTTRKPSKSLQYTFLV